MIKFLFYVFLFIVFLKWWFYDDNFYTTNLYIGKMGCGKTSLIAKQSQKFIRKGYKVYSNVAIPGCEIYNPTDIESFTFEPNSIVYCDEMGLIFNNRMRKNKGIGYIEFFKMCRQFRIQFHGFTQALDTDKMYLNVLHNLFTMHRIGRISIIKPVYKTLGISNDQNGNGQIVDSYKYKGLLSWKFIYLPRYYGLFNTFNPPSRLIINSVHHDYDEYSLIYTNTKKYILYKIKKIIPNIKIKIEKRFEKIKNENR